MKRLLILPFLAVGFLAGCGDPAPSTPVAPDVALPDTSKMSPEEIQKLHGGGGGAPADRGAAPGAAGGSAPMGHGDTPSDRGGG